ncbi:MULTISPECIES: hypothetical protein [unclassified Thermoactinomyces]|uniref:hypothetical protein n=1 Tax=unclassified Thermoactinomyces TaxID=2634588 RepID=UPI0018DCDC0C|nr:MULTISPECIES: hypothetical protein [unclassified Thermoactinomyces]MBH8599071.1 hypothetical protein [Thermoactinomyces sp. CICC 10523]MBH8607998.1 hypothetical protein [Thermoactinomyces sp. CICC 10521]
MAKVEKVRRIRCVGPVEPTSGVVVLRMGTLDIVPGQVLTIGKELSDDEARLLLSMKTWIFKEVSE